MKKLLFLLITFFSENCFAMESFIPHPSEGCERPTVSYPISEQTPIREENPKNYVLLENKDVRKEPKEPQDLNLCQKLFINVFGWPCCCCLCCMNEYGSPKPIRLIHRYCCKEEDESISPSLTEYFLTGGCGIICIAALASVSICRSNLAKNIRKNSILATDP